MQAVDMLSQTRFDDVFVKLQNDIIQGAIPQGTKLVETTLAAQFGISRGPLREALRRLESSGLLLRTPNAGVRVVELSHAMIRDIYQTREALEGMVARLVADVASDDEIADIECILKTHQQGMDATGGEQYFYQEGDLDFHLALIRYAKNRHLMDLLGNQLYHLLRMLRFQSSQLRPTPMDALSEHNQIFEAIRARDAALAELLMRRHISNSWRMIEPQYLTEDSNRGEIA